MLRRPPVPRRSAGPVPRRSAGSSILKRLLVFLVLLLAALWAASYFVLGVDQRFLLGLARAVAAPPRTPADVVAPAGVAVSVWAEGLHAPTSLAFGPDGRLYVAELGGQVIALTSAGQGAPTRTVYAAGLSVPLGLAFYENDLYVGRRGGVTRVRDTNADGAADLSEPILDGLPAARHSTNGLAFGPDGRLYLGQGSTSDRGESGLVEREAAILVAERDGTGLRVFATGTRNPYDLAFFPGTDLLFATDNGRDVPTTGVPDELNLILDGGHYGWPGCWGAARGPTCAGSLPPVADLPAHAAAGGLAFYTGHLFPQWRYHAFIALYGANSGDPTIGRSLLRVELTEAGGAWTGTVHTFATGFDRPLDVTTGPDGALYVADFASGLIYRLGAD